MKSDTDDLKMRVLQLKSKIPHEINYTTIYKNYYKVEDEKHINRVRDVWNLRIADLAIILRLEAIAEQYSNIKL